MSFRVIAIPTPIVQSVRETMSSPGYGHPAHAETASGHGPCRHCLRTFRIGKEKRILFTYDAFAEIKDPPLPGPVFVHADPCERYPVDAGFPEDLRAHGLTLNAYSFGGSLRAQEYVANGAVEAAIDRLLARPVVDYVHVRDTEAGCYDFRVERVHPLPGLSV